MSENKQDFIEYLEKWVAERSSVEAGALFAHPQSLAILCVDVTNGFCKSGALASPRVATIIPPIVQLFQRAWQAGCHNILLVQDAHEPDAVEFGAFPPHCVRGTLEAETVSELKELPFFDQIPLIEKNSIDSGLDTGLESWLTGHSTVTTFLVVGDCTDLCTYQLAMHLRLKANATQQKWRIIVPENCTETYDLPVESAAESGAFAHPGDFFHHTFLYHMALNGIEVVREIA